MLLVGIGGSGRQSLSRLGAYIIGFQVFQIEISRHYRLQEFREGTAIRFVCYVFVGYVFVDGIILYFILIRRCEEVVLEGWCGQ